MIARPNRTISTYVNGSIVAVERVIVGPEVFVHPRRELTDDDAIGEWRGDAVPDAEMCAVRSEQAGILAAVLRSMDPRRATILVRYCADEQTMAQIAHDLAVGRTRVQHILHRAFRDVRDALRSAGVLTE